MNDPVTSQLRDPGTKRSAILSWALWSIGYLIYIGVTSLMDNALPNAPLVAIYVLQYGVGLTLAACLILGIRAMLGWSTLARWAGTTLLVLVLTAVLALFDNASLIFLATHGHPEMSWWAHWSLVW